MTETKTPGRKKKKKRRAPAGELPTRNGGTARRKKKKKVRPGGKLDRETRRLKKQREEQKQTPEERMRFFSRGYKISFGGLPTTKKLNEGEASKVTSKDTTVDKAMLKQSKALLDHKHPAIKKLNRVKAEVIALFDEGTSIFPEPGVRMLRLKLDDIDFEKMAVEEVEKNFAKQMEEFSARIRAKIDEYFEARDELKEAWGDPEDPDEGTVLHAAKLGLKDLYDPDNYPQADHLDKTLYCHLRPYQTDLPKEYAHVNPVERQQALEAVEAQFREAVKLQEEFVVSLLHDSIDQMIESIRSYHNKEQRSFKNSVVSNVFEAFSEFKEKTVAYGILEGTSIEAEFERARKFMTEGDVDEETLPGLLRKSEQKRVNLVEKMEMVRDSIVKQAEKRRRRNIVRD